MFLDEAMKVMRDVSFTNWKFTLIDFSSIFSSWRINPAGFSGLRFHGLWRNKSGIQQGVCDSHRPLIWLGVEQSLTGSTFLQQTFSTGYPRLLRLFHEFFAKIAVHTDTVYTQGQQRYVPSHPITATLSESQQPRDNPDSPGPVHVRGTLPLTLNQPP